jgi:vancomycin resistance protein VanJ
MTRIFSKIYLYSGLLYVGSFLLGWLLNLLFSPAEGGLAMWAVFAPHLWLGLLVFCPLSFFRLQNKTQNYFRAGLVAALVLGAFSYSPPMNYLKEQPRIAPERERFSVLTWNIREANWRLDEIRAFLRTRPADIVVLQETNGGWLKYDTELSQIYPHRLTILEGAPTELVLLSVYSFTNGANIINWRSSFLQENMASTFNWRSSFLQEDVIQKSHELRREGVKMLWASLQISPARRLTVVTSHPFRPDTIGFGCNLPFCYRTAERDRVIGRLRQEVEKLRRNSDPLVLAGDFNLTEREPVYKTLAHGLLDAHKVAGAGWGGTWTRLTGTAALRIDYIFATPDLQPLNLQTDCSERGSDHCLLKSDFIFR